MRPRSTVGTRTTTRAGAPEVLHRTARHVCLRRGASGAEGQDAWTRLTEGLGLTGPVGNGDRVRLTPEGLAPIEGIVDYAVPEFREFLGLRDSDGLYRFHGGCGQIGVGHHLFAEDVNGEEAGKTWQAWLNRVFSG